MRGVAIVAVAVIGASVWAVVRQLPESAADAEVRAIRPGEVQSVALEGRDLPTAALRAALATHAGDPFDTDKLEHDRAALEATLVARGRLAAKVAPAHVEFAGGGAFVTFAITAGPEFHVRSVAVTGASLGDTGVVTLEAGQVVSGDRLERVREVLADRLVARGKPATVALKLAPDVRAATVDVELVAR